MERVIDGMYKKSLPLLRKYIFSFCLDEPLTNKILQDVLFQAASKTNELDNTGATFKWLCDISHRIITLMESTGELQLPETSLKFDYFLQFENNVNIEQVKRNLADMDKTYKEVLYMHLIGKLSFEVISELYNRPERWARDTFLYAKDKMLKGAKV